MEPMHFSPRLALAVETESLDIKCGNKYAAAHNLLLAKIAQVAALLQAVEGEPSVVVTLSNLEALKNSANKIAEKLAAYKERMPLPAYGSMYSPRSQKMLCRSQLFHLTRKAYSHEFALYQKMAAIAQQLMLTPESDQFVLDIALLNKLKAHTFVLAQDANDFFVEYFPRTCFASVSWSYPARSGTLAATSKETEPEDGPQGDEESVASSSGARLHLPLDKLLHLEVALAPADFSQQLKACFTSRVLRNLDVAGYAQQFEGTYRACCQMQEELTKKMQQIKEKDNAASQSQSNTQALLFIHTGDQACDRIGKRVQNVHSTVARRKLAQLTPPTGHLYTPAIEAMRACLEAQKALSALLDDAIMAAPRSKRQACLITDPREMMHSYLEELDMRTIPALVTMSEAICAENNEEFRRRAQQLLDQSPHSEKALALLLNLDERLYQAECACDKELEKLETARFMPFSTSYKGLCQIKIGTYQIYELEQGKILTDLINSLGAQ